MNRILAATLMLCIALPAAPAFAQDSATAAGGSFLSSSTLVFTGLMVIGGITVASLSTTTSSRKPVPRRRRQRRRRIRRRTAMYLKHNRACTAEALVLPNACSRDLATLMELPAPQRATFANQLRTNRAQLAALLHVGHEESDLRFADRVLDLAGI